MNRIRILGLILLSIGIAGYFVIEESSNWRFLFGAFGGIGGGLLLIWKTKKAI
ncbi:MAG: hypothetical protein R6W85_11725 [Gillisia sp.]